MPIRGFGVQESHLYKSQIELKKFCGCELKHLQKKHESRPVESLLLLQNITGFSIALNICLDWFADVELFFSLPAHLTQFITLTSSSKIYEGSSFKQFSEKSTSCRWVFQKMEIVSGRLSISLLEALYCFCTDRRKKADYSEDKPTKNLLN